MGRSAVAAVWTAEDRRVAGRGFEKEMTCYAVATLPPTVGG